MLHQYLSFAIVALLLNMSPGPDLALLLRTSVRKGRRAAFLVLSGIKTAALCWGLATVLGLALIISSSPTLYLVIRVMGTGYLIYLGVQILREGMRSFSEKASGSDDEEHTHHHSVQQKDEQRRESGFTFWRAGFINNLLNPKVGIFYVAMVPQFVPRDVPYFVGGMSLSVIHVIVGLAWFGAVILVAERARAWLSSPQTGGVIDGTIGVILIVVGFVVLALEL